MTIGYSCSQKLAPPQKYPISFEQTGSSTPDGRTRWRVNDGDPDSPGITVHPGDSLRFSVENMAVDIQFSHGYSDFLRILNDDIKVYSDQIYLEPGQALELLVRESAPSGTVSYAVLIRRDNVLLEGDSVPRIIIKRR